MKSILFVMNVDWNWIKQRPHFIAEGLSKTHKVKIIYQYQYNRKNLQNRNYEGYDVSPMYVLPRIDRYRVLRRINSFLRKKYYCRFINKNKPNVLYLTYPTQVESIPANYKGRIIYDCMDNYPMFKVNANMKDEMIKCEKKLCVKSSSIICSSEKLREEIINRYSRDVEKKIYVVRNGFNGEIVDIKEPKNIKKENLFSLCYFGTISEWFDFNLILRSLNVFSNIKYVLYGPTEIEIPKHERIEYRGIIEHRYLYNECKDIDCFIMPFVLNSVIESVDPVKIYEYINFGKNIICINYPEVFRFKEFAYMYSDINTYISIIGLLLQNNELKYSNEERIDFLNNNKWDNRCAAISEIILH